MLKDTPRALANRANFRSLFPKYWVNLYCSPALAVTADLYCIVAKIFLLLHSALVLLFLFRFDIERLILLHDHAALLHNLLTGVVLPVCQKLILC